MSKLYLSKAILKGYKSIQNIEVNFNENFNVIIGKNGSGKTNILSFLDMALFDDFEGVNDNFYSEIDLVNQNEKYTIKTIKKELNLKGTQKINYSDLFKTDIEYTKDDTKKRFEKYDDTKLDEVLNSVFIEHGIPFPELPILDKPYSFSIKNMVSTEIDKVIRGEKDVPDFIFNLFLFFRQYFFKNENYETEASIKQNIIRFFNINLQENLKTPLNSVTEIEDLRINKNLSVNKISDTEIDVNNLFVEFLAGEKWYPFSYLSDGTKRLFYIIAEVSFDKIFLNKIETINFDDKIILLEEPELGLYPHTLFNLMVYLKEESIKKQIILSTHAPEVLDHLDKNELNKIYICNYSKEKQTTLRKLSEKDIKDAQDYMNDLELSDFWKHTNKLSE